MRVCFKFCMELNLTLGLYEGNMRRGKGKKGERRKGMGMGMGKGKGMRDDGVVVELGGEDEERKRP